MARNKEFILEEKLGKAKDLFWKKGYAATSMQDIVDTTGLNPGSIYGTFGSKHQLFLNSLKLYCDEMLAEYKTASTSVHDSPLQSLKAIIKMAIDFSFQSEKACLVVKTSFELSSHDKEATTIIKGQSNDLVKMFAELIRAAQDKGEIRSNQDHEMIALFIVGSFAGFWHLQNLHHGKQRIMQLADFLIESIT